MEHNELKPFIEDEIYPLTITADRYSGTYSGGAYIAWNLDANEIPEDIYYDDCGSCDFWLENSIVCGKGRTVSEAVVDLYIKLNKGRANDGT